MSQFGTLLQKAWKRNLFLLLEQLGVMESLGEQEHGMSEATLQELFLEAAYGMGYKRAQSEGYKVFSLTVDNNVLKNPLKIGIEKSNPFDL